MAGDALPPNADELSVLRGMTRRLRAGEHLDMHGVERALEAGFGALIGLEAELSRVQRAGYAAQPDARAAAVGELNASITKLRDALSDLRTLAVPPGEARVGYGFVLPASGRLLQARAT
jgi:hypothetical protein